MQNMSVAFYCPGRKVGGTNLLWARLAEYLVREHCARVSVVDYRDGFIARYLRDREIQHTLIEFENSQIPHIHGTTYLVADVAIAYVIGRHLTVSPEVKLFLWSTHPGNSVRSSILYNFYMKFSPDSIAKIMGAIEPRRKNVTAQFLTAAAAKGALAAMDYENRYWSERIYSTEYPARYLPIPMTPRLPGSERGSWLACGDHEINIGWLSRLSTDKIASLIALLANAADYGRKRGCKIRVHVIGSGAREHLLDSLRLNEHVQLIRCGTLLGAELDAYLLCHVDVLFGMGTSCLEGAQLAIPTVLLPFSYRRIDPARFGMMWLSSSFDYLLGWHWKNDTIRGLCSFEQIMDQAQTPENRSEIGRMCHKYGNEYHSITNVGRMLVDALRSTEGFTVADVRASGVLDQSVIEHIGYFLRKTAKKNR